MDTEKLKEEPKPWEFRSKPAWQRLIVMVAGVFMNLILGIIMFSVMSFYYGEQYVSVNQNDPAIVAMKLGEETGFRTGDTLYDINGTKFLDLKRFEDIYSFELLLAEDAKVSVIRNGEEKQIQIPHSLLDKITDKGIDNFINPAFKFSIKDILPESNAEKAGLKPNDRIISLNDTTILYYYQFVYMIRNYAGKSVNLQVLRQSDTLELKNVAVNDAGMIGFSVNSELKYAVQKFGFFESFAVGNDRAWYMLKENTMGFGRILKGQVDPRNALQGPISIARKFYGGIWIWEKFWNITALLSLILAFMNLLPIPALDGGHVITIIIEFITGKPLKTRVLEVIQTIGLIIIFGLMIFAIFNDVVQNFFK
jgi:regulator of sigma E protease